MRQTGSNRPVPPPMPQDDLDRGKQWVVNYYTAFDSHDASLASTFFTKNASLAFGSAVATGATGITSMVDWQFRAALKIDHCITAIHVLYEQLLVQTRVTYTLCKGERRHVDCMTVFHKSPSHAKAARAYVYTDFTALFEKFASIAGPIPTS